MSHPYEQAAVRILDWFHRAEADLVGKAVVTFNGEAGTVIEIKLDESHGLCFTIDDPVSGFDEIEVGIKRRWYPVATIKDRAP